MPLPSAIGTITTIWRLLHPAISYWAPCSNTVDSIGYLGVECIGLNTEYHIDWIEKRREEINPASPRSAHQLSHGHGRCLLQIAHNDNHLVSHYTPDIYH